MHNAPCRKAKIKIYGGIENEKVVYNVTWYRKYELIKISGLGYITDENLIIACISQNGKPYIRVFQDCIKDCHPIPDKPSEYKGETYEMREVQIDTGKDNYETREIKLEYKIWTSL